MASTNNKIVKITIIFVAIILVIASYFGFQIYQAHFYEGLIPQKIGIAKTIAVDTKSGALSGCGAAAFLLDDATTEAIKDQGISFFDTALIARSPKPNMHNNYQPWKTTPIISQSADGHPFIGMGCASKLSSDWKTKIITASTQPGSFYSFDPSWGTLLVSPELRLVYLDWFD